MKKFILLILSIGVIYSCSEEFTEISPVGSLNDASLSNATGINLLLTGAYSVLDGIRNGGPGAPWTKSGDNWWMDVIADDAHKGSTDGDQADLYAIEIYQWDTSNPYFAGRWSALFAGVNRANAVIALINSQDDPGAFTSEMAQARFLRGHYNFDIQRQWVNVPYISDENFAASEFNQTNSGPIWSAIEDDFTYAAANLPANRAGGYEIGRPIQSAAKAYLGRAQLYQGKWAEAAANLDAVISSGDYALAANYNDNFRAAGENGPEHIFAIQFATDGGQSPQGNQGGTLNFPGMIGCCGFYQPSQDLANAFQTDASGLPLLGTYMNTDVASDYGIYSDEPFTPHAGNLDPRIDFTVGRRGVDYNGHGINPGKATVRAGFGDISGPYISKKNVQHAGDDVNAGTGGWGEQRSGVNYHILRYADVILMAAEAAVETGQLEKARGLVNQIRTRAINSARVTTFEAGYTPNYVIGTYDDVWADQATARAAVRHERRIELGMEGHRLFDLRRWNIMVPTLNAYIANEGRTIPTFGSRAQAVSSKHEANPIPIYAIDQSGGTLSQNTGH